MPTHSWLMCSPNFKFNQRYINDFGEQYQIGTWAEGLFVPAMVALSLLRGQSPRGLRYRDQRPDYVVIDDLDDDELIQNESRIGKLNRLGKRSPLWCWMVAVVGL